MEEIIVQNTIVITLLVIAAIILFVALPFILVIKIWNMTNNVREILSYVQKIAENKHRTVQGGIYPGGYAKNDDKQLPPSPDIKKL